MTTGVSGSLATTTWTPAGGPYRVTGNITIPAGMTLTIQPGTTVFLNGGVSINVSGTLVARGREYGRIRFTRYPGTSNWSGIVFNSTYQPNEISYADIEYGDGGSQCIQVKNSQLTFDRCTILNSGKKHFDITNPQLTIRHSTFGGYKSGTHMFTSACMAADGWLIFDGNLVGVCQGSGDVDTFHLNHLSVKGAGNPVAQIINNVFLGAGDDILDDNETDTHIEGNFLAFAGVENDTQGVAAAITTGPGACGSPNLTTQHLTVVRNVFYKNNYGIINKTGAFATI